MAAVTHTAKAPAAPLAVSRSPMLDDLGKLLLRLTLGALVLLHGISKMQNGIDAIIDAVAKTGLPPLLAYGVFIGEVLAPLLLIAGVWTRSAALVIVINMAAAIALMHSADMATLSRSGGWAIELQVLYLAFALAVALFGPGRYAAGRAAVHDKSIHRSHQPRSSA
jgi:putative oxidoreductase